MAGIGQSAVVLAMLVSAYTAVALVLSSRRADSPWAQSARSGVYLSPPSPP